jgi:hypothetical protein
VIPSGTNSENTTCYFLPSGYGGTLLGELAELGFGPLELAA